MLRYLTIAVFLCLFFFSFEAHSSDPHSPTIRDHYEQAKFFYKQLESDADLKKKPALWLKGTQKFRKVYLANPKSEIAPAALFMLGTMHLRMYQEFNHKGDLHESIGYYRDCTSLFPNNRLADDALFALGNIYFKTLSEHESAARYYTFIVDKYPHGDMHPRAAEQLKILSTRYDVPLPGVMVDDSTINKLTTVQPVKYWSSDDYSRVIIRASGPVSYSSRLLEKNKNQPRRLYIDFENSYIKPRYRAPIPITDGLLQRIRTGQNTKDKVRVVLDIESISSYKIFSLPDPFRVVVDIRGVERPKQVLASKDKAKRDTAVKKIVVLKENNKIRPGRQHSQTAAVETKPKDSQNTLSLAQQLGLGVRTIVIDPGHGGKDPGAIGHGLKEKDIVLRLAKMLKRNLEESMGFEVILTRDDDRYIPLEERTAIANGNNADLFVSVHVNAHPVSSVHGIETYFLNLTSDKEAMRVAALENATSELHMSDLEDILSDIMKNSKIEESTRLAQSVHSTLVAGLRDSGYPLKDLGVKQAPFYVLIGAEMPAILLEAAFISNPKEARILKNDKFLESFAAKAAKGIQTYINTNTASLDRR